MDLAITKAVSAHWSDDIHEEWIRSLLKKRPDLKRESLERTRRAMNSAVPTALITGYHARIESLNLPDPNDRHVLAVAIHIGASCIVTNNLNDFPHTALSPFRIEAVSPDTFAFRLTIVKPNEVIRAARDHRGDLCNPPKTVDEYLTSLRHQGLIQTVGFLEKHRLEL